MRSALIISLLFASPLVSSARGQERSFPYEAVVEAPEVMARSGPGRSYYPTGKLSSGDRVMVHRHDPGGWYMIAPPPDSFSWIRAEYVRPTESGRGVLTANNVVVRVGSAFGGQRDVEQKRLSTGEEVEILGEETLQTERGPLRMYRIKPPSGEYRWVQGQFVAPVERVNPDGREQNVVRIQPPELTVEPPSTSSSSPSEEQHQATTADRTTGRDEMPRNELPLSSTSDRHNDNNAILQRGPSTEEIEADRKRLAELDDRFRSIIEQDTADWDFTQLEQGYRTLQNETSHPALASHIDLRLRAVDRYQAVKREYDEFLRITEETSRREAHLASLQQRKQSPPKKPVRRPTTKDTNPRTGPKMVLPRATVPRPADPFRSPRNPRVNPRVPSNGPRLVPPESTPAPNLTPQSSNGRPPKIPPSAAPPHHPSQALHGRGSLRHAFRRGSERPHQRAPRTVHYQTPTPQRRPPAGPRSFGKVGLVQRAAVTVPGAPPYVLISPNGRILAYLQPGPGVSLEQHMGRPVRVGGPRQHHRALKTDVIIVRRLAPVSPSSR